MAEAQGDRRTSWTAPYLRAAALTGFVCSAFAAVASWVVLALLLTGAFEESPGFGWRMFLKAAVFTAGTAGFAGWVLRLPRSAPDDSPATDLRPHSKRSRWEIVVIALVGTVFLLPNLDRFPWAAPDELHHLIVARNLAVHGAYASGRAPDALVYFDHYDSVGAPVIAPVAAFIRVLGASEASGRIPMALFGVGLLVAVYALFALEQGRASGTLAALAALGALGTVYLGRTLYGEAPAMMFFVLGLIAWRRGLSPGGGVFAYAAGTMFGLAVLTKSILALTAFAFAGVWLMDRVGGRRIGWKSIAITAVGAIVPLALWSLVEFLARDRIGEQPSTVVYYRHLLVFGLEPLFEHRGNLLNTLPTIVLSLLMLALAVPRVFQRSSDPAFAVLWLVALLYAFWWMGFTPMHLPRYLWYTAAIAAAFGGGTLGLLPRGRVATKGPAIRRWAPIALAAVIAAGYGLPLARVGARVYSLDQTAPDRELVGYVKSLPHGARLVTTYWPSERLINFATGRRVEIIDASGTPDLNGSILISSEKFPSTVTSPGVEPLRFGHYLVFNGTDASSRRLAEREIE